MNKLPCKVCKGSKIRVQEAFDFEGKQYPRQEHTCSACGGLGEFSEPEVLAVVKPIIATKGKNKGSIRASMSAPWREKGEQGIAEARSYYVWRMARFHGGIDVTMPMSASLLSRGDPYMDKLEAMASEVAKRSFGSDMVAALTWGKALGLV